MAPTADDSSLEAALEAQQSLLEDSLSLVFEIYNAAREENTAQPVVILLDCEDEIGGQIARSWLGETVDDAIAAQSAEMTTVFAHAFALSDCREQVPAVFPYLQPVFEEPYPEDGFLAISVTAGGASALTVPFEAEE